MIGIPCHKLVLMSSSQYFASIFERIPAHQSPVTYIMCPSELSYEAVKTLRTYMYQGEARVSNDILKEVLHGGDILKIRGLYRGTEMQQAAPPPPPPPIVHTTTPKPPPNKPPPKIQLKDAIKGKSPGYLSIKEEPIEWTDDYPVVKDELDVPMEVPPLPPPPDDRQFQKLSCEICGESFRIPAEWVNHVERHHAQFTSTVLAKRRRRSDPGGGGGGGAGSTTEENIAALMCDLCSTFFGTPAEWVKHIQSNHTELELALENDRRSKNGHDEWTMHNDEGPSHNIPIKRIPSTTTNNKSVVRITK